MPSWFKNAEDNIAKVKAVMDGDWLSQVPQLSRSVELRVGNFGDPAPNYLLMERTVQEGGPYPFHRLSVLFYSTDCKAFEMLTLDRLSDPGPVTTGDCKRSFSMDFQADGSLSFQYTDWNSERVSVLVNKDRWRETRETPGITDKREIELRRMPKPVAWGIVQ